MIVEIIHSSGDQNRGQVIQVSEEDGNRMICHGLAQRVANDTPLSNPNDSKKQEVENSPRVSVMKKIPGHTADG